MKKTIKTYFVDAFAPDKFRGNPAAVCFLEKWLPNELMQNIAMENNLSETAFIVPGKNVYNIRWFTPKTEVDLCGHATLAAAFIIKSIFKLTAGEINFVTKNDEKLNVIISENLLFLDFPSDTLNPLEDDETVEKVLNTNIIGLFKGKTDLLAIVENEEKLRKITPDFEKVKTLDCRGLIVTAKGDKFDFVSRFFAPQSGIDEDPVTGSAHTSLIPLWADILKKDSLVAMQLSQRGGVLACRRNKDRVLIGGESVLYMVGDIYI